MVDLPEPHEWLILFHPRSTWWVERLCPGPWKHVTALGFVPDVNVWVLVSWELGRFRVSVIPDGNVEKVTAEIGRDSAVLRVKRAPFDTGPWRPRAGLFCTSMVAHLLGLRRGAFLPTALWKKLVRDGAEIVESASAPGVGSTAARCATSKHKQR